MVLSADVYMPNGLYLLAWSSQQKLLNRLNNERLVFEFFDKNHIVTVFFAQRQGWRPERVKSNESNDA